MAEDFWGTVGGKLGAVAPDSPPGSRRLGFFWACKNLVVIPVLSFFKNYFLKGNLFRGRAGFSFAVHESVMAFGVGARRYELMASDKRDLERIRGEF